MEAKTKTIKKPTAGKKFLSSSVELVPQGQKGLASVGVAPTPPMPAYGNRGMVVRADGLKVFLDGDAELNKIRISERDPRKVILAVAIRRAQQIARSYAMKHTPSLYREIVQLTSGRKQLTLKGGKSC